MLLCRACVVIGGGVSLMGEKLLVRTAATAGGRVEQYVIGQALQNTSGQDN